MFQKDVSRQKKKEKKKEEVGFEESVKYIYIKKKKGFSSVFFKKI
jgi:hypothetical protein